MYLKWGKSVAENKNINYDKTRDRNDRNPQSILVEKQLDAKKKIAKKILAYPSNFNKC